MTSEQEAGEVLVGFDVGGSNVRARLAILRDGELLPHPDFPEALSRAAGDRAAVAEFVRGVVDGLPRPPDRAAVAFAGPVTGDRVEMTNWAAPREIRRRDLTEWGLPGSGTAMLNDVEAGAWGLVRRLCREGIGAPRFRPLRTPDSGPEPPGSLVLVVPGTGLGCAGVVRLPDRNGEEGYLPVASEAGHLPAAPLDDESAELVDELRHRLGPGSPSWEDLVSGDGLRTLYGHVCARWRHPPTLLEAGGDPAAAVARAAREGDGPAGRALTLYYRCVGRFAQALALAFRATGGVFLAGASTRANREFIEASPLIEEFLANREQRQLLEGIPVHLVLEELNLPGALAVAARR